METIKKTKGFKKSPLNFLEAVFIKKYKYQIETKGIYEAKRNTLYFIATTDTLFVYLDVGEFLTLIFFKSQKQKQHESCNFDEEVKKIEKFTSQIKKFNN